MLKDPVSSELSLVKGEWQWQEENQADPSLMQQPLDVVGKSEVKGGLQEASEDDTVCLCCPWKDTPENASGSGVDTRPAHAVLTPGGGTGEGQCTRSGCPQEVDRWSCHVSGAVT